MYCNKCGTEIPDDSVFCPECGSHLTRDNPTFTSQPSQSTINAAFPSKDGKGTSQGLPMISNSPRKTGILIIVAFGWTMIMWICFLLIAGMIVGAMDPDNAGIAGQQLGKALSIPSLLLFGCLSGILTKLGKLPGSKKN